jgi:hypothetical protein
MDQVVPIRQAKLIKVGVSLGPRIKGVAEIEFGRSRFPKRSPGEETPLKEGFDDPFGFRSGEESLNIQFPFVEMRREREILDIGASRDPLKPNRLPNAARGGIPNAAAAKGLLASGIDGALGIVRNGKLEDVLGLRTLDQARKRKVPPFVMKDALAIKKDVANLVNGLEMEQKGARKEAVIQMEFAPVMQIVALMDG